MNDTPQGSPPMPVQPRWLGWLLLVLVSVELFYLYTDIEIAGLLAKAIVVSMFVLAWRAMRVREFYLFAVCLTLVVAAWYTGKPVVAVSLESLSRAAYLASFILLMALLREGALTSPSVLEVGTFLTRQPSSRRFVTLFSGGHFFGVLINIGALSLLAPIIQRGVRANNAQGEVLDDISKVRERRQLCATLRGFSWILVWAPTSVTQAVMPTLMTGIDATRLVVIGLGLALLMFAVSWVEDTVRWRGFSKRLRRQGRLPLATATRFPKMAARNLGLVCLALFGLSIGFTKLAGVAIVTGVMLTTPIIVCIWICLQQSDVTRQQRRTFVIQRLNHITFTAMPGYIRETMFIACAGFIGTIAARLVPAADVAALLGLTTLDGWIVLWGLSATVWIFGQVGLSPVTMAIFLGSIVAELPDLPVDMTHAALAIAAGTAICTTGAPFSSGAVLLSRATGHSAFDLTLRWNGLYSVLAMLVLGAYYMALTQLG